MKEWKENRDIVVVIGDILHTITSSPFRGNWNAILEERNKIFEMLPIKGIQ